MDNRPRGRAALKEALLRSLRRPGEDETASTASPEPLAQTTSAPTVLKPKPSRAELIQKLLRQASSANSSTSTPTESPSVPVSQVTQKIEKLQVTEPQPFKKGEKCKSGAVIGIKANYIHMNCDKGKGFHRYEVKFSPDVDSKAARHKLIKAIVPDLGGVHIFNGMNDLYLPMQQNNERQTFEVQHPFNPEMIVQIVVIYKRLEHPGSKDSIHFLNVLFKRIMNQLQMIQINRNYFDFSLKKCIPQHNLEIIPGFAVAVDEMEGGLMICLDTCHKLLRKKSVLELISDIRRNFPNDFKGKATDELLGQTILTTYSNMNYIVDDILWDITPTHTFETKSGPVTYIDYFKNHHGVEITNHGQPLLLSMKKKKTGIAGKEETFKICLIPELCNLTGISQDLMNHKFLKDMAEHTRLTPAKRFDVLNRYIQNVRYSPEASKILKDWGLSINDGVIDLNARVLSDNKITFRNRKIDTSNVADWGTSCARDNLINPINMTSWIALCTDRDVGLLEKFIARLCGLAKGFGCVITPPKIVKVGKGADMNYREALEQHANDNVQIFLIVVPIARDSLYNVLKNTTLARKGILSQVVKVGTLNNDRIAGAVTLKLGLQMQAKLGGSLWGVVFPSICNDFMFCGIDTFHSKGHKKSVGALTCTIDERQTRYYTGLAFQAHEIADALKLHFKAALEARRDMTGRFPSVVFMVRDGVGDGQLEHVREYEMKQYLSVGADIGANFKFCFIVIQKRNNTRFMLVQNQNPPPGTVVDHTITRKNYEDFYLVPQATRIGTVSPVHYIVLHNDSPDLNLERIQKLCFKLCHLYYNWTGTVSVPAPCQYAHKAAYLIGEHMERKPLDSLNDKLYYL